MKHSEKVLATVEEWGAALKIAEEESEKIRKNERLSAMGKQEEIKKITDALNESRMKLNKKLVEQFAELRKESEPKATTTPEERLKAIQILTATGANTTAEIFEEIAKPLKNDVAALKQLRTIVENVGCKSNIEGTKTFEILTHYERLEQYTGEAERYAKEVINTDRTGAGYGIAKTLLKQVIDGAEIEMELIKAV